ncbi:telomerase Cajal body protein 1-like [Gigantopelta aegis]|uniref:telomerase Cajal body protein 1-like n=1 Tax=Gigantopelta aegis TaxID=1735272 RepID=UPI001B88DE6C|nr:telomerase Cajal body protein 1-like [Gigantopelta aegis]
MSGNNSGDVTVWDTIEPPKKVFSNTDPALEPILTHKAHEDAVNGISVHPSLPLFATSSGQRHFTLQGDSSDSDTEESGITSATNRYDNSLRIWSCNS